VPHPTGIRGFAAVFVAAVALVTEFAGAAGPPPTRHWAFAPIATSVEPAVSDA
jgi:hypothetical protein